MRTKIQGTAPRSCRWFKSNKGSHKDHTEMCGLFFCFRFEYHQTTAEANCVEILNNVS